MTVKELLDQLQEISVHAPRMGENQLRILVKRSSPAIGARHTVGVDNVGCGIDWEHGMFLITADEAVYAGLKQLEAAAKFARKVRDAMYWRQRMDDTRQKNANALASIERALDEWLPDRSEKTEIRSESD
jgi:hypothetical protein